MAAPPYDVLSTDEARVRAAGKPWSFLHISKPEIDLPPGTDPTALRCTPKPRKTSSACCGGRADARPRALLLRLPAEHGRARADRAGRGRQWPTTTSRIRKHELTRPDKEDDRVRQVETLGAQTGPVLLAYKHNAAR